MTTTVYILYPCEDGAGREFINKRNTKYTRTHDTSRLHMHRLLNPLHNSRYVYLVHRHSRRTLTPVFTNDIIDIDLISCSRSLIIIRLLLLRMMTILLGSDTWSLLGIVRRSQIVLLQVCTNCYMLYYYTKYLLYLSLSEQRHYGRQIILHGVFRSLLIHCEI